MELEGKLDSVMRAMSDTHKKLSAIILQGIEPSLNQSHVFILIYIRCKGGCTVTEIANHLDITLSAVTSLVDKLCTTGLVVRIRSDKDRRVVFMKLTDRGEEVLDSIYKNKKKLFKIIVSNLTAEEIDNFFSTIEKMTENILYSDINEKNSDCKDGGANCEKEVL